MARGPRTEDGVPDRPSPPLAGPVPGGPVPGDPVPGTPVRSIPVPVVPAGPPPAPVGPTASADVGGVAARATRRKASSPGTVRAGVDRSLRTIASATAAVVMAGTVAGAATGSLPLAVGLGALLLVVVGVVVQRERSRLATQVVVPIEQLAERSALAARGVPDATAVPADAPVEVLQTAAGLRALGDRVRAGQALLRRRDAELERYDDDLAMLVALTRDVTGSANVAYVLRTAARAAMNAGGVGRAVLWLKDEGMLRGRYDTDAPDAFSPATAPVAVGDGRVGEAAAANVVVVDPDGRLAPGGEGRGGRGAAIPMAVGGRVLGVIELIGESLVELSPQQRWVLELVAGHTASVLHAARLENRADLLGRVDPVTGLANYRQFVTDLAVEVERAARYGRPLALVMLDLGPAGAAVDGVPPTTSRRHDEDRLVVAATVVDGESRACDSVYRFGRSELAVLVREAAEDGAAAFADRLCRRLQEVSGDTLGPDGMQVRAGVAALPVPVAGGAADVALAPVDDGDPGDPGDLHGRAGADGAELLRRAGAALAASSPDVAAPAGDGPVVCWSSLRFGPTTGEGTDHPAVAEGPSRSPDAGRDKAGGSAA